jgi:hypothetical protein
MSSFWWIFFINICFWVSQNKYFGWNMFPQSDTELIADGITMLIMAIAISTIRNK